MNDQPDHPLRRVVPVLCVTEITSWGVLFYAFPVVVTSIRDEEGWTLTSLFGAFTVAQLVAAVVGVWVGRRIDVHGPRGVMTAGSAVAVAATLAVAWSPSLTAFFAAWALAGTAMAATLYAPAFAAVTGWAGTDVRARVRGLTAVTLVAGFSSTAFAPLTALLLDRLDWRTTYVVLAVVLAATVPAHWLGLDRPWTPLTHREHAHRDHEHADGPVSWRSPEFVTLTVALTLAGFTVFASIVNLVPLLTQSGLGTTEAAIALGVGGAGQVAGRLVYGPVLTRLTIRTRTVVTLGSVAATTAALAVWQSPWVAVMALSFVAGSARGIYTLIQATAVSDRWGIAGFGVRNGIVSGAVMAATALGPWAGAALASAAGSYAAAFWWLAAAAVVGLGLVVVADHDTRAAAVR
jgi:MFS family permease